MENFEQREFPMTDDDFWELSKLAYLHAGIVLKEPKKNLLYGRLSRRIRALKLKNFRDYINLIKTENHQEFDEYLNTITTNLTSFFRENHHFEYLKTDVFPFIESQHPQWVRFWSAGCSTGEEAYSIAMTALEHFRYVDRMKILATDLDANVLKHGRSGIYDASRVETMEQTKLKRHFKRERTTGNVQVKDSLREMVTFNRLNLLADWPMKHKFDVIFCRNVLIYFDKETQERLIHRYVRQLNPRGFLIIGHSENISHHQKELDFIGHTIYRKRA